MFRSSLTSVINTITSRDSRLPNSAEIVKTISGGGRGISAGLENVLVGIFSFRGNENIQQSVQLSVGGIPADLRVIDKVECKC